MCKTKHIPQALKYNARVLIFLRFLNCRRFFDVGGIPLIFCALYSRECNIRESVILKRLRYSRSCMKYGLLQIIISGHHRYHASKQNQNVCKDLGDSQSVQFRLLFILTKVLQSYQPEIMAMEAGPVLLKNVYCDGTCSFLENPSSSEIHFNEKKSSNKKKYYYFL